MYFIIILDFRAQVFINATSLLFHDHLLTFALYKSTPSNFVSPLWLFFGSKIQQIIHMYATKIYTFNKKHMYLTKWYIYTWLRYSYATKYYIYATKPLCMQQKWYEYATTHIYGRSKCNLSTKICGGWELGWL